MMSDMCGISHEVAVYINDGCSPSIMKMNTYEALKGRKSITSRHLALSGLWVSWLRHFTGLYPARRDTTGLHPVLAAHALSGQHFKTLKGYSLAIEVIALSEQHGEAPKGRYLLTMGIAHRNAKNMSIVSPEGALSLNKEFSSSTIS